MVDDNVYLAHDPEVLRGLASDLTGLGAALNQLTGDVSCYNADLGAAAVVNAFSSICNNWWVERDKLVQEFTAAGNALVAVSQQYADDETKIASAGNSSVVA
jgi:hypothetical protein